MTADHDLGYRLLFAHPEMVRELITGFTSFTLFDEIPLSAFERVNAAYVSERPSARHGDVVWRVQVGEQFLYVYILLECQSGVDRWMALRMQAYVGLLCQDLVRRHELSPGLLLPPVLPLVFYNGLPRWSASMDLAGLLMEAPAELALFQPSQRYVLIDQQRMDRAALDANKSLLALLFQLELSRFSDVLKEYLPALTTWFKDSPQTGLRSSVQAWLNALLARRSEDPEFFSLDKVEEDADMEAKALSWAEEMQEIGFQKGCAKGVEEGQAIALRRALASLLRGRFGNLPEPVERRIGEATQAQLEQWFERSLTSPSLSVIFGEGAAATQGTPD
ncbi:MAG TPA: Rpn family recombination-promoting nuclease/putative transposase [Telluria sp.]|jgi:hypothetical protein